MNKFGRKLSVPSRHRRLYHYVFIDVTHNRPVYPTTAATLLAAAILSALQVGTVLRAEVYYQLLPRCFTCLTFLSSHRPPDEAYLIPMEKERTELW